MWRARPHRLPLRHLRHRRARHLGARPRSERSASRDACRSVRTSSALPSRTAPCSCASATTLHQVRRWTTRCHITGRHPAMPSTSWPPASRHGTHLRIGCRGFHSRTHALSTRPGSHCATVRWTIRSDGGRHQFLILPSACLTPYRSGVRLSQRGWLRSPALGVIGTFSLA